MSNTSDMSDAIGETTGSSTSLCIIEDANRQGSKSWEDNRNFNIELDEDTIVMSDVYGNDSSIKLKKNYFSKYMDYEKLLDDILKYTIEMGDYYMEPICTDTSNCTNISLTWGIGRFDIFYTLSWKDQFSHELELTKDDVYILLTTIMELMKN